MQQKKLFSELVFYMEACNSGSMFAGLLPNDINVYATTAASATEPSWGAYCPPNDVVQGRKIGACLGDLYSINWLEDSDTAVGQARTLSAQFERVRNETATLAPHRGAGTSHVMEFGAVGGFDETSHVSDFQGHRSKAAAAAAVWHG